LIKDNTNDGGGGDGDASTLRIPTGFKKILVPIDGSAVSMKAAAYGIHLAEVEKNTELMVIHVIEDIKQGGAIGLQARYGNVNIIEGFHKAREKSASQWIDLIKRSAEKRGVKINSNVLTDNGTSEVGIITDYANKHHADLIILGSKGQSRFKQLLLGSVANAIVSHSRCPVMVIR
jgi:nucleotide-binding universal stress UspA family protein